MPSSRLTMAQNLFAFVSVALPSGISLQIHDPQLASSWLARLCHPAVPISLDKLIFGEIHNEEYGGVEEDACESDATGGQTLITQVELDNHDLTNTPDKQREDIAVSRWLEIKDKVIKDAEEISPEVEESNRSNLDLSPSKYVDENKSAEVNTIAVMDLEDVVEVDGTIDPKEEVADHSRYESPCLAKFRSKSDLDRRRRFKRIKRIRRKKFLRRAAVEVQCIDECPHEDTCEQFPLEQCRDCREAGFFRYCTGCVWTEPD